MEYDPTTFAVKQTVKVPAEAVPTPANVSVNRLGQILFATPVSVPLSEEVAASTRKVWIWNGHSANTIELGSAARDDCNRIESGDHRTAPAAFLSADGTHLFWFANQARRLQREGIDLSTVTTWQAWQTDLSGAGREGLGHDEVSGLPLCDWDNREIWT